MTGRIKTLFVALALALPTLAISAPAAAQVARTSDLQVYRDAALQREIAAIAQDSGGRIGFFAMDLESGGTVSVNADAPFPMASTAKIAIAATFLDGVDRGLYRLDQKFPLLFAVAESGSPSSVAPKRAGDLLTAQGLMELMITRSSNQATDALLDVVGGPAAVNAWLAKAGIAGQRLDHDMATLVRDDGRIDPSTTIDKRTSSTPRAMVQLLAAIDRGAVLSPQSRSVLLDTMTRTVTGKRRLRALLPDDLLVAHKTGTLYRATCDVGIIRMPDGRHVAVAAFVTGPGAHRDREPTIARLARAVYDGYREAPTLAGGESSALQAGL